MVKGKDKNNSQPHRKFLWVLLVLVVIFTLIVLLWKVPELQVESYHLSGKEEAELIDKYRSTLAQILGGLTVLITVFIGWRRIIATERRLNIAQQGQITERFSRAVEQLGKNDMSIKLGGIYALERIAKESEQDQWVVMEVLTAYICEHTPLTQAETSADIKAIITVIRRRDCWYGQGESEGLNLKEIDLRGANFEGAHLEHANFYKSRLENAAFSGAFLEGTIFEGAHLENADLSGVSGFTDKQKAEMYSDKNTKFP